MTKHITNEHEYDGYVSSKDLCDAGWTRTHIKKLGPPNKIDKRLASGKPGRRYLWSRLRVQRFAWVRFIRG
jgi:hypothetical protein